MSDLINFRTGKDQYFANDPYSPLTPQQKADFKGLQYFPENPVLRFHLPLEKTDQHGDVEIQISNGDIQVYNRYGVIHFEVNGEPANLTIFANEYGLFLPFVDSLAGVETYGAGRYLEPEELPDGKLLIDFNLAYNPYCAYNEVWSCPLTPWENRLKVPIHAGEKLFQKS
jgi:uncharacterized protein (DUF1684 family)